VGRRTLIATCAAGAAGVGLAVVWTDLSLSLTLALLAAVAAAVSLPLLVRAVLRIEPRATDQPYAQACRALTARSAPAPARPRDLLALTRNAYDLNVHFRPFMTGVVRDLLRVRARVDLARDPDRARTLLGPELCELVWPREHRSLDYSDPGLDPDRLQRLLDDLDGLDSITR
jgi:hypothetical protein